MKHLYVIFDIDGVVVDSERLHFDVLKARLPVHTLEVKPENLIGLSLQETLTTIGVSPEYHDEIIDDIVNGYKAQIGARFLRPGIRSLINNLIEKKIPFGFVSTAPRNICLANIAILDLEHQYQLISGDDTQRTKPYPDPYLAMLQHLNACPERTIVIEDTDLGIQAAKEAGIELIYAWPHSLSGNDKYVEACKVISSLNEIDALDEIFP